MTAGDLSGIVADPSGAVVPATTVVLKSLDTSSTRTSKTIGSGEYRFRLLKPGLYMVAASLSGFQNSQRPVEVYVGNMANTNLTLQVGESTPLVSTEPSIDTAFTPRK